MKCYYINSINGKTVYEPREAPVPQPKKGEILVKVRAASLNLVRKAAASLGARVIGVSRSAEKLEKLKSMGMDVGIQAVLAIVGYVDDKLNAEVDLEAVHGKRLHIFGVSNAFMSAAERGEAMRGFVRDLLPGFAQGRITPIVDRVFPFHELPAAKAYVESNAQLGKVVVTIP